MNNAFYKKLSQRALAQEKISPEDGQLILTSPDIELLRLLDAAFQVRRHYWGRTILIHILNNVQNGACPEDCHYCAQSHASDVPIHEYPMKSDDEILTEAHNAYEKGAFRYCMVFSGAGQSMEKINHLAQLIREIKTRYPLEVCVSPGTINPEMMAVLKEAGLDRINHNINTSRRYYPQICTTHDYQDRLDTLMAARTAGLDICCGVIIGMGENTEDILDMTQTLSSVGPASVPVNFFIPMEGLSLPQKPDLSPEFCLRVLCLFRLTNPSAEIRVAAGRELYLRHMEVLAYYAANSLFLDGYLNVKGSSAFKTLQMIQEAGFDVKSDRSLQELLQNEEERALKANDIKLKGEGELHPTL